jgi:hypothetical protein
MKNLNEKIRALCESKGLRFKPWEIHPGDADVERCPYPRGSAGATSWPKARILRKSLVAELARREGADHGAA